MATKIYKPGQGYWIRLLTAVGAGVVAAAAAVWLWQKFSVMDAAYVKYVQAGAAVVVLGLCAWMVWKWVGVTPKSCDFLIATEGEMKKVNWPTRKEVIGSTWIVICCVFLMASILFVSDLMFATFFRWIGVLQG